MDVTGTQGARTRSIRYVVLVVIAFAIVLSVALVGQATHRASTGGQNMNTRVAPITLPAPDPAAQIHVRVAEALDRLQRQGADGGH